jgi:hypothetical protein
MRLLSNLIPIVFLVVLAAGVSARSQDHTPDCGCLFHRLHNEGTPPPGKPRDLPHTYERAGYPRLLSDHLEPSATPGGIGYYVGGGASFHHSETRRCEEGTWGWDETGCHLFRHRSILGWFHGRRYQGGTGAYATDGRPLPDYVYGITSSVNSLRR